MPKKTIKKNVKNKIGLNLRSFHFQIMIFASLHYWLGCFFLLSNVKIINFIEFDYN